MMTDFSTSFGPSGLFRGNDEEEKKKKLEAAREKFKAEERDFEIQRRESLYGKPGSAPKAPFARGLVSGSFSKIISPTTEFGMPSYQPLPSIGQIGGLGGRMGDLEKASMRLRAFDRSEQFRIQ